MSEKVQVARTSAIAGGTLAVLKITVGLLSGSLALISEGIHSTLDFAVTLVTWLSVKNADVPADREHHYGHGKMENLAAFAESMLLIVTALGIFYESYTRLTHPDTHGHIDTGIAWVAAVAVVTLAIVVDFTRSRALHRAAKKHNSQALEADALHFGTELISSAAVLLGLLLLKLPNPDFRIADPIAALVVAVIMLITGIRLAHRAAAVLVDRAPAGVEQSTQQLIAAVPGVRSVQRLRARQSGARTFIDATITVDPAIDTAAGHEIADNVELRVTEKFPHVDILVHLEPASPTPPDEDPATIIHKLADAQHLPIHALRIREIRGNLYVAFDATFPPQTTLAKAHEQVTDLEEAIRQKIPTVADVLSHIEPIEQ